MKKVLPIFILFIVTKGFAQIKFEKGYFIDNVGDKTECYIKNVGWKYNPVSIDYKLSLDAESKKVDIKYTQEFGFSKGYIFKRAMVQIDRSKRKFDDLSLKRAPEFKTETVFLKLVVKGAANL